MTRLLVHVEGQTEERFVNEILAPHLYKQGYGRVGARLVVASVRIFVSGWHDWRSVQHNVPFGLVPTLRVGMYCGRSASVTV